MKISKLSFVVLACFAASSAAPEYSAAAQSLHVATTGNDANSGAANAPLRNVQTALSRAANGDTIKVAAGMYAENAKTAVQVILRGGYDATFAEAARNIFKNRSVFRSAAGTYFSDANSSTVDGFIFDGSVGASKAVVVTAGHTIVTHNIFHSFFSSFATGVDVPAGASVTVKNNTFANNILSGGGTLIYILYIRGNADGLAVVENNIVVNNNVGVYLSAAGITANYNCVFGNTYRNYDGPNAAPGANDLAVNPVFVNASNADFRLKASSPCNDAGNPADRFGEEPAPNGGRIDMGAYGGTKHATSAALNPSTYVSTLGSDSNPGTRTAPLRNIQTAVSNALGDTIKVAAGIYSEGLLIPAKVVLRGGYDESFTEPRRDIFANLTTLRGISATMIHDRFGSTIDGLFLDGNAAAQTGFDIGAGTVLTHNVVIRVTSGSGMAIKMSGNAMVVNNTVRSCTRAISIESGSAGSTVKNNILANNSFAISNSVANGIARYNDFFGNSFNYTGGFTTPGLGDLAVDPQFRNATANDFRLLASSLCVNAGDPSDPVGEEPQPNGGRIDMGAYGGTKNAPAGAGANQPPVVADAISNQSLTEGGQPYTRDFKFPPAVFTDPDGDALTYTASSSAPNIAAASISGNVLTVVPVAGGNATITVTANDGRGGTAQTSFAVTVLASTFTEIFASLTGVRGGFVTWGDYDNDGDLDILLTGNAAFVGFITKLYRNNNGSFVEINTSMAGVAGNSSAAWGDYDNDGDLDILLVGNTTSGFIAKVYRNESGSFVDIAAALTGVQGTAAAWGDYDNDGDLDILITGSSTARIYRNDEGAFVNVATTLAGVDDGAVVWGDYDKDGDLDILLTGNTGSAPITKIYRNDGGIFTDLAAPLTGVKDGSAAWGDYDSDGDLDILLTGSSSSSVDTPVAKVYRNDGGSFTEIAMPLTKVFDSYAIWGDYNNDGNLDILLTGGIGSANYISKVYRNEAGSFVDTNILLPGVGGNNVAWGDYDNDGDLDMLLTGDTNAGLIAKIYRNNTTTANTAPSAPTDLISSVTGRSVSFSWNKATDSRTMQNALTYNLRIGTMTNGVQRVSPMANVTTGLRKVVMLGNTNHRNSWTIKNLPDGTYFWSVQAIDNAFAGSAFATEQSFTVGTGTNRPPVVANAISNPTITVGSAPFTRDLNMAPAVFNDPDGDVLTYTASSSAVNIATAAISGSTLTVAPVAGGTATITVTANDGRGGTVSTTFMATVNRPPVVSNPIADKFFEPGTSSFTSLGAVFSDPDGDVLSYTASSSNPAIVTASATGAQLNMAYVSVGIATITVVADDGRGGILAITFKVTCLAPNRAPTVANPISNQMLMVGGPSFTRDLNASPPVFSDPDGDALSYSASASAAGVATATITGSMLRTSPVASGTATITVTANDGRGRTISTTFMVTVGTSSNQPPVVANAISNQTLTAGGASFTRDLNAAPAVFNDPDGDALTYTASSSAANFATANISGSTLTVAPVSAGNATITVTANDNKGGIVSTTFMVTVSPAANRPPVVANAIPNQTLIAGGAAFTRDLNVTPAVFNDPDGDALTYSANSNATNVATANISGSMLTVTPVGTGTATISITANDGRGGSVSTSFGVTVRSNLPPSITHTATTLAQNGLAIPISANVTDDNGIASVQLNYRRGGATSFSAVTMNSTGGAGYQALIPVNEVTSQGVEYFILVMDVDNAQARHPASGSFSIQIQVSNAAKPSAQPNGSAQTAFRLISVPLLLDNPSATAVLEDDLGPYDDTKWRLFGLAPVTSQDPNNKTPYVEFRTGGDLSPGKSLFLIVADPGKTITIGAARSVPTAQEFQITLQRGHNFIGTPFNFTIPANKLRLQSSASVTLWTYNGSFTPATELQPWGGYYIANLNQNSDVLFINPNLSPSMPARVASQTGWRLQILTSCGQARDDYNFAGVAAASANGYDDNDLAEPPPIGEYVSVYFPHPEWQKPLSRFSDDMRSASNPNQKWRFVVESNITNEMVSLRFDGLKEIDATSAVFLVDEALQYKQNLRENAVYSYQPRSRESAKAFTLIVGKENFISEQTANAQGAPENFVLEQNFPNPFGSAGAERSRSPETAIRFGLPQQSVVTIKIFDLAGHEVATLLDRVALTAGRHQREWDGRDALGRAVVSGIYFCRLTAAGFAKTVKLTVMR